MKQQGEGCVVLELVLGVLFDHDYDYDYDHDYDYDYDYDYDCTTSTTTTTTTTSTTTRTTTTTTVWCFRVSGLFSSVPGVICFLVPKGCLLFTLLAVVCFLFS